MTELTTIVWREWFDEDAVKKLTEMGTLPRNEADIDTRYMDGDSIAAEIAEKANQQDSENFREGGELVILEPEEFADPYEISTKYEPRFYAYKSGELS